MLEYSVLIIFIVSLINAELTGEIPSYIKRCNQSDPRIGSCIRNSIQALRPHLANGIKELDIPSLDPLMVPEIKLSQNGAIMLQSTFKNIVIHGATKFRLRSIRSERSTSGKMSDKFRMKVWFPELFMEADYELTGQLMMLPIKGNGKCNGNFTDIDSILSMKLNRVLKKSGELHFEIEYLHIDFNIGAVQVHLDNLFNSNDPEMGKTLNRIINENWKIVTAEVRPKLEKTISVILKDVAEKIFNVFPINKLMY